MNLKQKSIITALLLIVLFSGGSYADDDFSKLVIFGDSLSDTGNLASVQGNFPFPFFNLLIKQRLGTIKKNFNVRLTEYRSIPFSKDVVRNGSGLDLINTDANCFSTQNLQFTPACDNGANLDRFFYFDEIHPTSVVHQRIGRALYALVPMAAK